MAKNKRRTNTQLNRSKFLTKDDANIFREKNVYLHVLITNLTFVSNVQYLSTYDGNAFNRILFVIESKLLLCTFVLLKKPESRQQAKKMK